MFLINLRAAPVGRRLSPPGDYVKINSRASRDRDNQFGKLRDITVHQGI